ncbi:MAG: DUF1343 domain-containing protein [Salinivirgaceae bacterium]|jgi:uncharacterized protein YbbC (DUF1343 family)|nr:DUF1343 domain-containing protein [Salinivirgaceae bacterium]
MLKYSGIIILIVLFSCKGKQEITAQATDQENVVAEKPQKTLLGIDVLQQINFDILHGKRIGLVTNQTGVDSRLKSTIDIFHESQHVNLVALFSPEHGVRGNFSAGDLIGNQKDEKTNVPVFSLYGKNKRPSMQAVELIDAFVYDIQDIGVRSYTYISTLGMIMEVAAEYGKEVIVLDRPNPLGGEKVEGALVEDGFQSFVSQYKIPYIYGLTCGELARLINYEGMLTNGEKCSLQVVPMQGWSRKTTYDQTGLLWLPTSPHIPTFETAFYYAATGILGELDPNYIGIGYTLPFKTLVTSNIEAEKLCKAMNDLNMEGVLFRPIYYKPYYKNKKGEELQGVQIHITDYQTVKLTKMQFCFIQEASKLDPTFKPFNVPENVQKMFDLVCGTDLIRKTLSKKANFETIQSFWNKDAEGFKELSNKYYLYE